MMNLEELLNFDFVWPEKERLDFTWAIRYFTPLGTKYGWTDDTCLIEGQKCCVWRNIPPNEVQGHMMRFVNLWFSSIDIDESKICSTIRNVLLMFPLGLSDHLLLQDIFDSATDTAEAPSAADDDGTPIKEPLFDHLDHEKKADALAFHDWLKQHFTLLERATQKPLNGRHCSQYNYVSQKLRTVIGFCALLLIRMMTKSELRMERCFPYLASKLFDRLFPELELNVCFVCPTPNCLKQVRSALSPKKSPEAINLLHLLVFQYLKSNARGDASSKFAAQILEDGCLKVLEGNGMGLVTMFREVKLLYSNIEERWLLSFIAHCEADKESKKNLIKFLDTYARNDDLQYSWRWARILSKDYFNDLNIRQNKPLCSKLAALLLDKHPAIFDHHDLETSHNVFADYAIKWAESVKEELENLNYEHQEKPKELSVESLLSQWAEFVTNDRNETLFNNNTFGKPHEAEEIFSSWLGEIRGPHAG